MNTARFGNGATSFRFLLLGCLLVLSLTLPPSLLARGDLEEQARLVAAELRCPVCQNLSVADSPSEMASQMRALIRAELEAGKTPEEIKAYFVSKYGDWILLSPRPRGLSLLVWIGPFVALAVGLGVAILAVRRWARRPGLRERPRTDPALLERVRQEAFSPEADAGPIDPERLSPPALERERLYAALRELDCDHRSGKLSRGDYEAMREEYEHRAAAVLAQLDQPQRVPSPVREAHATASPSVQPAHERYGRWRPWRLAAGGVFLLIFGLAVGYFLPQSLRLRMGERDTISGDFLTGTGPGGIAPESRAPARHLQMLIASGRAAYERQDWKAAIDPFKQALTLDPENPEALSFLGMILFQGGHGDDALLAIERALRKHPNYPFALWAKGMALFESKQDYTGAINAWETLMAQDLATADADQVARMITEARKRLAGQSVGSPEKPTSAGTITGTVALAPSLRPQVPSSGALFIIARRGDGPPLAVKRIFNPTFPLAFALGPEDQMVGGTRFEGEVTLLARVKRDGTAGPPAPGDLEGRAPGPVRVGHRGVEIVLDKAY